MKDVHIKLESIRDDQRDKYWAHLNGRVRMGHQEKKGAAGLMGKRPFVKEVVGVNHASHPIKKDVKGKKCYRDAVGTGARGVYYWYVLKQGRCYYIQEQVSRKHTKRYFVIINNGIAHKISKEQVVYYISSADGIATTT